MKNKFSVIFILLSGALWGSSCLFVNKLTEWGFSSFECTAIRVFIGTLILNAAVMIGGIKRYKLSLASYGLCALSGICSVFAMCVFYYNCMTDTSAAVSAILLYTAPIFVMIMSVIFFKEKITAKKIVAFCLAIVGCALVSGIASGVSMTPWGLLSGVASGFAYSLYGIITAFFLKLNGGKGTLIFSALSFAFASVGACLTVNPVEIVRKAVAVGDLPLTVLFFICFGLCTAVLPYVFYTKGLERVRPDVASILAFSEPLTAAVFGIFVLGQSFDVFQGLGIILVVGAIIILNISKKTQN